VDKFIRLFGHQNYSIVSSPFEFSNAGLIRYYPNWWQSNNSEIYDVYKRVKIECRGEIRMREFYRQLVYRVC